MPRVFGLIIPARERFVFCINLAYVTNRFEV